MAENVSKGIDALGGAAGTGTPNKAGLLSKLYALLYGDKNTTSFLKRNNTVDPATANTLFEGINPTNMLSTKPAVEGMTNTGLGTTAKLGLNMIKDNTLKTAGLGLGLGANIAGLFDNSQIGGQAIGMLGGYAIPKLLNKFAGTNIGGFGTTAAVLGGGFAGSLFDKLIAKKKEEEALAQQYAQQQYGGVY